MRKISSTLLHGGTLEVKMAQTLMKILVETIHLIQMEAANQIASSLASRYQLQIPSSRDQSNSQTSRTKNLTTIINLSFLGTMEANLQNAFLLQ